VLRFSVLIICLVSFLPRVGAEPVKIIVAADGSGQFTSVQAAIMSVPQGRAESPVVTRIKPGRYNEQLYVQREKTHFHLIGEDPATTIVTYNLHANMPGADGKPLGTFRTPSTTIDADDFHADNITFENSAGAVGQALAITVNGDRAVFRNCHFLGWQDTIFLNRGRQLFQECTIKGHVDFIFGGATAFFDRCNIHCLKNGYITAASTPDTQRFGFVFRDCKLTGDAGVTTYLGRPWRDYSAVAFVNCEMSSVVRPEGWHNWDQPIREYTSRYCEFGSKGEGAQLDQRVRWAKELTEKSAEAFSIKSVLGDYDGWDPGVVHRAQQKNWRA
jgi:pectinesterase